MNNNQEFKYEPKPQNTDANKGLFISNGVPNVPIMGSVTPNGGNNNNLSSNQGSAMQSNMNISEQSNINQNLEELNKDEKNNNS